MTSKRVLRYYCDHCRKGGCQKAHMSKHELGCIRNPGRACGYCRHGELTQKPMPELLASLTLDLKDIRVLADNCPGCILAAIVQSGWQRPPAEEGDEGCYFDFNFKAEVQRFWQEQTDGGNCH